MAEIVIMGALVMGALIALLEIFFVHADEAGMGWFKHAMHAAPFAFVFVFIVMNVEYALELVGLSWPAIAVQGAVALIALVKIQTAAAIAGKTGEKFTHTLIIALLILASPYVWDFVGPLLPSYLQ